MKIQANTIRANRAANIIGDRKKGGGSVAPQGYETIAMADGVQFLAADGEFYVKINN